MTIMGILSAFSLSVVALVLKGLEDAKSDSIFHAVWAKGPLFVVFGCALSLGAALLFYRQRSLLAWYYGQLCLVNIGLNGSVEDWLQESTTWHS